MCVLFAASCLATSLHAVSRLAAQETTASLRGTVTDGSGAAVSNVQITAIQAETGLRRGTASDAQGAYVLVALPVGHYRLEAQASGFKKYVQEGISMEASFLTVIYPSKAA